MPDNKKTDLTQQQPDNPTEDLKNHKIETNSSSPQKKQAGIWMAVSAVFLILIAAVSLYLANPSKAGSSVEMRSITLLDAGFDTPITFQSECTEDQFNAYTAIVKDTFVQLNEIFDPYNSYEDAVSLKDVNAQAADSPVTVSDQLIDILNLSSEINAKYPAFDAAQGKLLALWHDQRESENPQVPAQEDIAAAINPDGMSSVVIDGNTVSFSSDITALDLGGVAKGYAAQQAADALMAAGCTSGFINAGGNVVLIGSKADGSPWKVGIQDPDSSDSLLIFETDGPMSMVTSGDYQRYFEVDGVRYSHIISPFTGYPETFMRSVTVITPDSGFADAMSTALFGMSVEEGLQVCEQENINAVWITEEGTEALTPDFTAKGFDIYVTPAIKDQIHLSKSALNSD